MDGDITVDAVLTKLGREAIINSGASLADIIKYFAVSDIGIDYGLWNNQHPDGSDYYGEKIENMPLPESSVDPAQMRYLLVTLDRNTMFVPTLNSGLSSGWTGFSMNYADYYSTNNSMILAPSTEPATEDTGFIFTITNTNAVSYNVVNSAGDSEVTSDVSNTIVSFKAKSIAIKPKLVSTTQITNIVITSLSFGASNTLTITVNPPTDTELTSRILASSGVNNVSNQ